MKGSREEGWGARGGGTVFFALFADFAFISGLQREGREGREGRGSLRAGAFRPRACSAWKGPALRVLRF